MGGSRDCCSTAAKSVSASGGCFLCSPATNPGSSVDAERAGWEERSWEGGRWEEETWEGGRWDGGGWEGGSLDGRSWEQGGLGGEGWEEGGRGTGSLRLYLGAIGGGPFDGVSFLRFCSSSSFFSSSLTWSARRAFLAANSCCCGVHSGSGSLSLGGRAFGPRGFTLVGAGAEVVVVGVGTVEVSEAFSTTGKGVWMTVGWVEG